MGTNYNTALVFGVDLGDLSDPDTYDTWAPAWMLDDDGSIGDWDPGDHLARKLGWADDAPFPSHVYDTEPGRHGLGRPADRGHWIAEVRDVHPDYIAYKASRDHRAALLKAADYGCSLDSYGHCDGDLALLVKVDASEVTGDVWRCVPVDPATLNPSLGEALGWAAKLERYLDALEIPVEHRPVPGWLLTGSVG